MNSTAQNKFWKKFSKVSWEKKPLLVKNFESAVSEINENEIFKMLVDYSNKCRKLKSADGFKLYVDGQLLHPEEVIQFLPNRKDKTLKGYHLRMETYYPDYCLVCDELLQVSQKNGRRLQDFTNTLFSYVGFPNRFVEMGLYLGNYRKTPFGVHVDGCGVFSFTVVGKKTFRLWKPDFAKKNPKLDRSLQYGPFKKQSQTLKALPGDMTYWPSSAWHIAESSGDFSVTWSLGIWVDRTHRDTVAQALKPLLDLTLGRDGGTVVTQGVSLPRGGEMKSLPSHYLRSLKKIKKISEKELNDAFMKNWLKIFSKGGFKTLPPLDLPVNISIKSYLQIPDVIIWTKMKSVKKNLYAFQGRAVEISVSKNFQSLVDELNKGQICLISDYFKGTNKLADLKSLKTLLGYPL